VRFPFFNFDFDFNKQKIDQANMKALGETSDVVGCTLRGVLKASIFQMVQEFLLGF
jgi:hypothetical protein